MGWLDTFQRLVDEQVSEKGPVKTAAKLKASDKSVMDQPILRASSEEIEKQKAEEQALSGPTIFGVSIDPTDYITPGGLAKIGAGIGKSLGSVAGLGILRQSGMRGLNAIHGTTEHSLVRLAEEIEQTGKATLHSPSFEITKDELSGPKFGWGDTSIIPDPRAVDPKVRLDAHLYNRDAYVARSGGKEFSEAELKSIMDDSRLTEGEFPGLSHSLSILASPRYYDFKDYEQSTLGAGALARYIKPVESYLYKKAGFSDADIYNANHSKEDLIDFYDRLEAKALAGETPARQILKRLKEQGSEYGELKLTKGLDVNSSNILATIVNPGISPGDLQNVKEAFAKKDIPVGEILDFISSNEKQSLTRYVDSNLKAFQEILGKASSSSVGGDGSFLDRGAIETLERSIRINSIPGAGNPQMIPYISGVVFDTKAETEQFQRSLIDYYVRSNRNLLYKDAINNITEQAVLRPQK